MGDAQGYGAGGRSPAGFGEDASVRHDGPHETAPVRRPPPAEHFKGTMRVIQHLTRTMKPEDAVKAIDTECNRLMNGDIQAGSMILFKKEKLPGGQVAIVARTAQNETVWAMASTGSPMLKELWEEAMEIERRCSAAFAPTSPTSGADTNATPRLARRGRR